MHTLYTQGTSFTHTHTHTYTHTHTHACTHTHTHAHTHTHTHTHIHTHTCPVLSAHCPLGSHGLPQQEEAKLVIVMVDYTFVDV